MKEYSLVGSKPEKGKFTDTEMNKLLIENLNKAFEIEETSDAYLQDEL